MTQEVFEGQNWRDDPAILAIYRPYAVSLAAKIGAAKADLLPRLALTGDAGYSSSVLEDLLKDASSIWSLAGSLAMPLLNRGARTGELEATRARAELARHPDPRDDYPAWFRIVQHWYDRDFEAAVVADPSFAAAWPSRALPMASTALH